MGHPPGSARAIGQSLRLYHGDPARARRMVALYAPLVPRGGLAFDIGAHVGDRVSGFRGLGARVVAVEPQPAAFRALRLIHGRDGGVVLIEAAAGAAPGVVALHLNTANPTVATASPDFIDAARDAPGWEGQVWDDVVEVERITLDALIARHGTPDFIKIDVEGLEDEVLAGLSVAVAALSFEITTIRRAVALRALERVARLGRYRFNLSLGEAHSFEHERWLTAEAMARALAALPDAANSGDVYARLTGSGGEGSQ